MFSAIEMGICVPNSLQYVTSRSVHRIMNGGVHLH